jgi:antitoxin YefM
MSEDEYEGPVDTVHLLKSAANAARLLRPIRDADKGKLTEREIIELPNVAKPANEKRRWPRL